MTFEVTFRQGNKEQYYYPTCADLVCALSKGRLGLDDVSFEDIISIERCSVAIDVAKFFDCRVKSTLRLCLKELVLTLPQLIQTQIPQFHILLNSPTIVADRDVADALTIALQLPEPLLLPFWEQYCK